MQTQSPSVSGDLINMRRVVSHSDGATTSKAPPVTKSIHHLPKVFANNSYWLLSQIWFKDRLLEIVYHTKYVFSVWEMMRTRMMTMKAVGNTHITDIQCVILPEYISRTGVPCSLYVFVSSSHTRPDCAGGLFPVCCRVALCLLLLGQLLKCCSEYASKTQCTDVAKTQNKNQAPAYTPHTHIHRVTA